MNGGDPKPAGFELTSESLARAEAVIAKYPEGRQQSAVLAVLDLCQRQNGGWLSQAAIEYTGRLLDMAAIRVHEVASFYTMLSLRPVGRHRVNVCTTTPCWLRGSDDIVRACEAALGIQLGETTADGEFRILFGIAVAAFASPFLNAEWLQEMPGPLEVIVFAFLGMPSYVCASGATPLVAILIAGGVSPGAGLAFLLTGPATNVTTFGVLSRLHGRRLALAFGVCMPTCETILAS